MRCAVAALVVLCGCAASAEPWPEGCSVLDRTETVRRAYIDRVDLLLVVDPSAAPDRARILEAAMEFLEEIAAWDNARFDLRITIVGATLGGDAPGCDAPAERGLLVHGPFAFVADTRVPDPIPPPLDEARAFLAAALDDALSRRCEYSEPFGVLTRMLEARERPWKPVHAIVFTRRDDCTRASDELFAAAAPVMERCSQPDLILSVDAITSRFDDQHSLGLRFVAGFPADMPPAVADPALVAPAGALGCAADDGSQALGARRLAEVASRARSLRHEPISYSVCAPPWQRLFEDCAIDLGQLLYGESYFPNGPPARDTRGLLPDYELLEELAAPRADCAGLAGREPVPVRFEDDRPVCRIRQLVGAAPYPVEPGWYYYDGPPSRGSARRT